MGAAALPIAIIGTSLLSAGTSLYSQSRARKSAVEQAEKQTKGYQRAAMSQLKYKKEGAIKGIWDELAARGFGSASGFGTQRLEDIESSYAKGLADILRDKVIAPTQAFDYSQAMEPFGSALGYYLMSRQLSENMGPSMYMPSYQMPGSTVGGPFDWRSLVAMPTNW